MDFGLTETQELIRASAREFLEDRSKTDTVRAVANGDKEAISLLWKDIVDLGWTSVTISEQHGGSGLSFNDLAVLLEELGSSLAPTPLVESSITSWVIDRFAPDSLKSDLLPKIANGDILITPAIVDQNASWNPVSTTVSATRSVSSLFVTGEKRFVAFAEQATHAMTLVRIYNEELALVAIPIWKSESVEQTPVAHGSGVPVSSLMFNELEVSTGNVIATGNDAIKAVEELTAAGGVARAVQLA